MLAAEARRARQEARKELGSLKNLMIAPSTYIRYQTAVQQFFEWMDGRGQVIPGTREELDDFIIDYIDYLWQDGEAKAYASDVLSGLQYFVPSLKGSLKGGWRILKAWQQHELPARAPPLDVHVIRAMVGQCFKDKDIEMAALLLVGFEGFLRVKEMLELKTKDVIFNQEHSGAMLDLGLTKSGRRKGITEQIVIEDIPCLGLLQAVLEGKSPGDYLWSRSPAAFRKKFGVLIDRMGFTDLGFKPYSIRRGGATYHFRSKGNLSQTMERGRWQSPATARIYIQESVSTLQAWAYSNHQKAAIKRGRRIYDEWLES